MFVTEEEEEEDTTAAANGTLNSAAQNGAATQPVEDVPATPEAPKRVRCHSKEFNTQDLDLINSVEGKRMASMESIPLDDVPSFPTLQPAQNSQQQTTSATTTVHSLSLLQQDAQQYDLNTKKKILPLSKIRPTSKSLKFLYVLIAQSCAELIFLVVFLSWIQLGQGGNVWGEMPPL